MKELFKSLAKLAETVVSMTVHGYTLATLWGWFVVTTFAAPVLSIPAAIGLRIIVRYLTINPPNRKLELEAQQHAKQEGYSIYKRNVIFNYCACAIVLLMGYVVHKFFM